ncbi:MAG TPA: VanZ family protein [Rhizomicrobium sp.]|jgi:VanZ family protein|nr:VanZ family protein [Rhizomicrobium sp.]
MPRSRFDRNYLLVAVGVVAIIVHGSLYPYAFFTGSVDAGPLETLLGSWASPPTSFGDFVANVLLYMPLGFCAVLALRSRHRLLLATLVGLALCTAIEIAQFYDQGRVTNMSDVYLNTFGTWFGGIVGILMGSRSDKLRQTLSMETIPALLLLAMLAYRLFPYVPVIDLHKYWHSLKPLLHPNLAPWPVFHYFALWLTICWLIGAVVETRRSILLIASFIILVFVARMLIVGLSLTAPDLIGAAAAFAIWSLVPARIPASTAFVGTVLCIMVVLVRLEPFDFRAGARAFGWLPFRSYLSGSLDVAIVSFLEKFFLYGSLIWIGSEAGLRLSVSTGVVAALLFATSLAEVHLPGRSAEITDAAMAIFIGAAFMAMTASARASGNHRMETADLAQHNSPPFKKSGGRVPTGIAATIAGSETERSIHHE